MNDYNDKIHTLAIAIKTGYTPFCERTEFVYGDGTNNGLFSTLCPTIWSSLKQDSLVKIRVQWVNGMSIENGIRTKLLHPYINSGDSVLIPYSVLKDDLYFGMLAGMHVHVQLYSINNINPC